MTPTVRPTPAELDALLTQRATTTAAPEVAALRSALSDLRACSLAVAERGLPAPLPLATPRRSYRFFPHGAMASATAAMALAIALPAAMHRTRPSTTPTPDATHIAQANPNVIPDDALLADIQSDLNTSLPDSLQPLATITSAK
jgi:hypothetical protein